MSGLKYIDEQTPTFFISSSSLEGRFDPYYYNSALKDFTENQNFPVKKIYEVVKSFTSGFGVGRQDQADADIGLIQIRPTNLDQFGLLKFDRNVYIPKDLIKHEGQLLEKGDVIFNNTNSQEWVGKAAYYDLEERLAFSNHITVLKVDDEQIDPRYLWLILNLYQQKKIFFSICTNWNNQSGVGLDLLKSLKIPVPDPRTQETIIETLQSGYQRRAELNNVCNSLLDGIDSYILNELGITLPEKDTSIEARMFQTTFQELSGRRFDPSFHSYDFSLESTIYPNCPVLDLVDFEPGWKKVPKPETEVSFVPMDAVDDKMAAIVGTETRIVAYAKGYTKFQEGDILWAKITPCMQNGKSTIAINLKNGYGYGSTEFYVLRCRSSVDPDYLLTLLRLKELRNCATLYFGGASGHQRVSPSFFKNLVIPIPPIEKQREIGREANRRRFEAQRLSIEADKVLEDARAEIEQMILN
ncbi:restriction endonuclease subunit S [uncultured Roseivirga sp.]|uniref:restriction endonuclease subunit S n=1 Tax=uncultured Roseivirga sp. TaxID=543088 RepID=UPI000D791073|nr:restriction endonuclease subunit S [uncultured Roseivirga sp.]PWL24587.1 MAG: hypothetical protein DCO95_18545 [Roseivirga sp. XM-24bin3]